MGGGFSESFVVFGAEATFLYFFIGFSGEVVGGGGREVDNGVWARNEASLSTATNDVNLTQEFDRKAILHAQVLLNVRTTGNGGAEMVVRTD